MLRKRSRAQQLKDFGDCLRKDYISYLSVKALFYQPSGEIHGRAGVRPPHQARFPKVDIRVWFSGGVLQLVSGFVLLRLKRHREQPNRHDVEKSVARERIPPDVKHRASGASDGYCRSDDQQNVENRGADDHANPTVRRNEEGADNRREERRSGGAGRHEGRAGHVRAQLKGLARWKI